MKATELIEAYVKTFKVTWWQLLLGRAAIRLGDQEYQPASISAIAQVLASDQIDKMKYEAEGFDCDIAEMDLELAWVWGLFGADGSCSLRKGQGYSGAAWRIVNRKLDALEDAKLILEQQYPDLLFPLRLYPCYGKGVETNYGKRKSDLFCLEVAPRQRQNDGLRGKFIEEYRELFYNSFDQKRVPHRVCGGIIPVKQAYLEGYDVGNGSPRPPTTRVLTTNNIENMLGLAYLIVKNDYDLVSISKYQGKNAYDITWNPTHFHDYGLGCDDFTFALMGAFHHNRETAKMAIFILWAETPEGGHAVCSFHDGMDVMIIEPQNDKVFSPPRNWKLRLLIG